MNHNEKLLNEIKVLLDTNFLELEFLNYSHQAIYEFYDSIESLAHGYAIEALELRDANN